MCRPTTCRVCGKTTWAGCGRHIAQVKAKVPAGQWCDGSHPGQQPTASTSLFTRLFGR